MCVGAPERWEKLESGEATSDDINYLFSIQALSGGYCIGGRVDGCGPCDAIVVEWYPWSQAPLLNPVVPETPIFWGQPWVMHRLIYGFDESTLGAIQLSDKWTGTRADLVEIVAGASLIKPRHLPIRESIDWIHTVIHTTCRGVKFAQRAHVCGGPVEIAVITTDRPFRWVCHKEMDSAITAREAWS